MKKCRIMGGGERKKGEISLKKRRFMRVCGHCLAIFSACPGAKGASTCKVGPEAGARIKEKRL